MNCPCQNHSKTLISPTHSINDTFTNGLPSFVQSRPHGTAPSIPCDFLRHPPRYVDDAFTAKSSPFCQFRPISYSATTLLHLIPCILIPRLRLASISSQIPPTRYCTVRECSTVQYSTLLYSTVLPIFIAQFCVLPIWRICLVKNWLHVLNRSVDNPSIASTDPIYLKIPCIHNKFGRLGLCNCLSYQSFIPQIDYIKSRLITKVNEKVCSFLLRYDSRYASVCSPFLRLLLMHVLMWRPAQIQVLQLEGIVRICY